MDIPNGTHKGCWFRGVDAGRPIVCLWCPGCNALGVLSDTHEIGSDGTVTPSVECDCGFHEHITLQCFIEPVPDCYSCKGTGTVKGFGMDGQPCPCLDRDTSEE